MPIKMMNLKIPVLVALILFLFPIPATIGGVPFPSLLPDSRSSHSFPSYDKPQELVKNPTTAMGAVNIEITKPAYKPPSPVNMDITRLPMGISLDRLHRNIGLGLQRLSSEPDACWIPIKPMGPIRIPMSVAYIDGYYCDAPWIPHVYIPG